MRSRNRQGSRPDRSANAHDELQRHDQIQGATNRLHWSVPDPVQVGTDDAFDVTFDNLAQRVTHLAPRLAPSRPRALAP